MWGTWTSGTGEIDLSEVRSLDLQNLIRLSHMVLVLHSFESSAFGRDEPKSCLCSSILRPRDWRVLRSHRGVSNLGRRSIASRE